MPFPVFPTAVQATWNTTLPPNVFVVAAKQAEHISGAEANGDKTESTLARLVNLLDQEQEDDYGILSPTQFAFLSAYRLISTVEQALPFLRRVNGIVCTDSQGGVRVTWRNGDREIRLICPATNERPIYVYQQSGTERSTTENIAADVLGERLSWLANRVPVNYATATTGTPL